MDSRMITQWITSFGVGKVDKGAKIERGDLIRRARGVGKGVQECLGRGEEVVDDVTRLLIIITYHRHRICFPESPLAPLRMLDIPRY